MQLEPVSAKGIEAASASTQLLGQISEKTLALLTEHALTGNVSQEREGTYSSFQW